MEEAALDIAASIGFNFSRQPCFCIHPSDMHIVWAQGSVIVVKSIGEENNRYLKGHEGRITTITISLSGNLMATGEMARGVGQPAALIVWDFNRGQMQFRVKLHTQHVQSLSFNCEDTHLISVGGAEDRSRLVMWNL
jgi:WD40 repeat protein